MDYKSVIESKYNRDSWLDLLHDIFRSGANFRTTPIPVDANSPLAIMSLQLGTITLADDNKIAVYEVKLSESVDVKANRVGIRNLLKSDWKSKGYVGAFLFCHRENESVLRFSYVSSSFKINDKGFLEVNETDTKRFTYLLGAGHRCRTAIKQFEELKASDLTLNAITSAFSLDTLNDRFFEEYRAVYSKIVQYVTGKKIVKEGNVWKEQTANDPASEVMLSFSRFVNPEKAVRDYVKKLMGRLVFLQFIQKKGWLGVPANESWGKGDKEFLQHVYFNSKVKSDFINNELRQIFHDINTKREGDIASVNSDVKIPFLNGGLFECDEADKCCFRLPEDIIQSLLSFFDSYNFTIDENSPDDEEFGIDPEMLGRIFESLLEDNKLKGTFYTPKEIVSRICKDALINYLQSGFDSDSDKQLVTLFVESKDASSLGIYQREIISTLLRKVKVCDPAIGSGAFPIGMLNELAQCRMQLENLSQISSADVKKHIIERNLYGVDIEKGAVDIARLRLWLSLIIEEDTPTTLPNLEFKIIQGNSLMEIYDSEYFNKLDLNDISKLMRDLYSVKDHAIKIGLRNEITNYLKQYISLYSSEVQTESDLTTLPIPNDIFTLWHVYFKDVFDEGGFDIVIGNPPYVESKNYIESSPLLAKYIKEVYSCSNVGKVDLCIPFIEMGINLLNERGTLNYLTQRRFFMSEYGNLIREKIREENLLKRIYEYHQTDLFKGKITYVAELMLQKNNNLQHFEYGCTSSDETSKIPVSKLDGLWNFDKVGDSAEIVTKLSKSIGTVADLTDVKVGLQMLWKNAYHIVADKVENGLIYGYSKLEKNIVIEEAACRPIVQNESFPALTDYRCTLYAVFPYDISRSGDIYRIPFSQYYNAYPLAGEYLLRHKDLICSKVQTYPTLHNNFSQEEYWHLYTREQNLKTIEPKVVIPMTTIYPKAAVITTEGVYCDNSNVNFVSFADNNEDLLYAFAGVVNSVIFRVMAKSLAIELTGGYSKYNKQYISKVPIPVSRFNNLDKLVYEIANISRKIEYCNNSKDFEGAQSLYKELNHIVQELYGINDTEYQILRSEYHEKSAV